MGLGFISPDFRTCWDFVVCSPFSSVLQFSCKFDIFWPLSLTLLFWDIVSRISSLTITSLFLPVDGNFSDFQTMVRINKQTKQKHANLNIDTFVKGCQLILFYWLMRGRRTAYRHKDKRDRRDDRDNHNTENRPTSWVAFLKWKLTAFFPTYPILPPGGVATPSPSRTDPDGDTVCIRTLPKVGFKRILWFMKITHNETLKINIADYEWWPPTPNTPPSEGA